MVKALLLDCYGTIISTGNGSIVATNKILNKLEKSNIDAESFYREWKKIHKYNEINLSYFKKEKEIFIDDLRILYEKYEIENGNSEKDVEIMLDSLYGRQFYDDTIDVLKKMKEHYKLYIASNSDTEPLLDSIKGYEYLFDDIYTSERLECYKPNTDFYNKLIDKIHFKNDEVLFIGDSLDDDIIGAKMAGIDGILIDRNNKYSSEEKHQYTIVNKFMDIEKKIKEKEYES
jgi:2-haloalkanoic acid dehalogenase type II